uniref:Uncharacterized protein n=1 Tax=Nelumbo nucifera TaxID=4432 RepID=A0A822ZUC1_NELNU|nr:TPA_asm: hypothetical protein HUJ06_017058 [Nelumbo nucifera]
MDYYPIKTRKVENCPFIKNFAQQDLGLDYFQASSKRRLNIELERKLHQDSRQFEGFITRNEY